MKDLFIVIIRKNYVKKGWIYGVTATSEKNVG